jgi:CheY-like chemotaxis protein
VDADADQHEIVGGMLSHYGYDVAHALSYTDAVRLLASVRGPACIICEWNLPDARGGEAVRKLMADERLLHTPILVCTADATANPNRLLNFAGVRVWTVKPCTPTAIFAVVRAIIPPEPC